MNAISVILCLINGATISVDALEDRGREGQRPPRPPNRACGSPAHGSPVGVFLNGIGSLLSRLHAW